MALQNDFAGTKKTALDGYNIESGAEKQCDKATNISRLDYNTGEKKKQGFIEGLLSCGAENAIPAAELAELAGVGDTRILARLIQEEREAGKIILSTPNYRCPGYYLPDSGEKGQREIAEYVRSMVSRATKILRSVRAAKAALEVIDGQQEIER